MKHTQNILGIFGVLLLVLGILSLVLPYSATVNNNAYAQTTAGGGSGGGVNLGPLVLIQPPDTSTALDTVSDGQRVFTAYASQQQAGFDLGVYLALLNSGAGGRGEALQDAPAFIIPGGTDPAIAIGGGKTFVTATRAGQGDIAIVECGADDDSCEDPQSVSSTANDPPVSDAGPDQTVNETDTVTLNGTGSSDPNNDLPLTYAWTQIAGPSVELSDPTAAEPTFTAPDVAEGSEVLSFNLTVTDSQGLEDPTPDTVTITVNDVAEPTEDTLELCTDEDDNDGDELVDSEDPDCVSFVENEEVNPGSCSDEDDNDGDELVDSEDPGCDVEPPGIETSCFDGVDGDGDGEADEFDSDCAPCFNEPTSSNLGSEEARIQFISTNGDGVCPVEQGDMCDDGEDNDGDGVADGDDPDCNLEGGGDDAAAAPQGGGNDTTDVEPATFNPLSNNPKITFVQNGGGSTPPASNSDIAASTDGDVYIVWEQDGEIMFRAGHGCADGCEYGPILDLSQNNAGTSKEPRVATSSNGQFVHVAWQDNTPGNDEIFYSRSTNGGETFNNGSPVGPPRNLSNTPRASNDLQLLAEGSRVYVVWVDFTTGNGDIYFKRSNDNGQRFGNTINLSRGSGLSFLSSRDPDMAAKGSLVSVIWTVYPTRQATGPGEIIFRESTNNGNSFGSHIVISKTLRADSKEPQVDYTPEAASERYVAWNERVSARYNVFASESDNGRTFSQSVNLSNAPNEPGKGDSSQLQVVDDVAIWDPRGRRG